MGVWEGLRQSVCLGRGRKTLDSSVEALTVVLVSLGFGSVHDLVSSQSLCPILLTPFYSRVQKSMHPWTGRYMEHVLREEVVP